MKVKTEFPNPEQIFQPRTFHVTVESLDELKALWAFLSLSGDEVRDRGSDTKSYPHLFNFNCELENFFAAVDNEIYNLGLHTNSHLKLEE